MSMRVVLFVLLITIACCQATTYLGEIVNAHLKWNVATAICWENSTHLAFGEKHFVFLIKMLALFFFNTFVYAN